MSRLCCLQLTFTLVGPGGLTKTYSGPETLFNIVNAPPTMTPACKFTPITKPSAYRFFLWTIRGACHPNLLVFASLDPDTARTPRRPLTREMS